MYIIYRVSRRFIPYTWSIIPGIRRSALMSFIVFFLNASLGIKRGGFKRPSRSDPENKDSAGCCLCCGRSFRLSLLMVWSWLSARRIRNISFVIGHLPFAALLAPKCGWTNGQTNERTNGRTHGRTNTYAVWPHVRSSRNQAGRHARSRTQALTIFFFFFCFRFLLLCFLV